MTRSRLGPHGDRDGLRDGARLDPIGLQPHPPTALLRMTQLTTGQRLFNQRLLAEHCLPEHKLRAIWEQLAEQEDMGAQTMEETMAVCNEPMRSIGLEIRCIAIKNRQQDTSLSMNDISDVASTAASVSQRKTTKYYAIVNSYPDEVAKAGFLQSMVPGETTYIKVILENLVEEPQSLATLLNLRPDSDQEKISLPVAEQIVYKLLDDKWLEWTTGQRGNSALIQMAPRTYMELAHLLSEELGMEKENMPQSIIL